MTKIAPHIRTRARELRSAMTPQERRLWRQLQELNRMIATNFRKQAPVGPFIADFADLGRQLIIEVDGGGHGGPGDQSRDDWFRGQGFTILRVWNADVDGNVEGVMQMVLEQLETAPHPHPLPTRGRGGLR